MGIENSSGNSRIVLTAMQQEAVNSAHRFIAVVAGPGSGKTRVLTERICHLVNDCGVDCRRILAVSFSSKAAGEVAKRLRESLGNRIADMGVSTFHSFGLSMIRENASLLGFKDGIEILTPTDRNRIIRKIWDDQRKKGHPCSVGIEELIFSIGLYKGGTVDASPEIVSYCEKYNAELKLANCVDFDDMILLARKLLLENETVRARYQEKYLHVMVDEVQDMNRYQTDIIQQLIGPETSLFIVGDDDQCIYEWRGAVPDFLKDLAKDSKYHVIHLDDNFRSEGAIVRASSSFIERNVNRIRKNLQAKKRKQQSESTATTYAYRLSSPGTEAAFIAKTIQDLTERGTYRYDDFTILIRKHSQTGVITDALSALEIPYHIQAEEASQFDEFLFFLRSFAYMDSRNNISKVINYPTRVLDNFDYEDLCDAHPEMKSLSVPDALKWLYENRIEFDGSDTFRSRYGFLMDLRQRLPQMSVTAVIREFYRFYTEAEHVSAKTMEKLEKIQHAIPLAEDYDLAHPVQDNGDQNLIGFLDYLSLSAQDDSSETVSENAVNIMTCHRSKGLEFPVVFIPGVQVSQNKEMHPYSFISGYHTTSADLLEAERRLFYVAMTRAIDRLYITCSADPYIGSGLVVKRGFLAEMPEIVVRADIEQSEIKDHTGFVKAPTYGSHAYDAADIDYEDINDIARSDGFFIDEDGHWVPLEDMPGYDEFN